MKRAQASADAMIELQLRARGISNPAVLKAMRKIPREEFVPEEFRSMAYDDRVLPIGKGQTISQPMIVAYMLEKLALSPESKVLEIGTGCGYNTALLARLAGTVYSVENVESLHSSAKTRLKRLKISNIQLRHGDGYQGWPEAAPFDAIILTAAPPFVPEALFQQLKVGGRLIAPVGEANEQSLNLYRKSPYGIDEEVLLPVRFVPMVPNN